MRDMDDEYRSRAIPGPFKSEPRHLLSVIRGSSRAIREWEYVNHGGRSGGPEVGGTVEMMIDAPVNRILPLRHHSTLISCSDTPYSHRHVNRPLID